MDVASCYVVDLVSVALYEVRKRFRKAMNDESNC